jgi:phospholipid/cholesterol/gamma-HCH transport system permease protein
MDRLTITRDPNGDIVVGLVGRFRMDDEIASTHAVDRALDELPAPRRVSFDSRGLAEWDSTLIAVLFHVVTSTRRRGIEVDASGLPAGARRLVGLVESAPAAPPRARDQRPSWIAQVGELTVEGVDRFWQVLELIGRMTFSFGRFCVARARSRREDIVRELTSAGAAALPIVSVVSVLLGMILAFVGSVTLTKYGAAIYVADVVAIGMVRELGAVMTAIVMAGRTGSAYASELSTMNVTQEIDALVTLGIDPVDFLVLPRMVALMLMMPLLYFYANVVGMVGGGVVAVGLLDLTPTLYIREMQGSLPLHVLFFGTSKSIAFGALVALAGCAEGMRRGGSAADVGRAATNAVVRAIVWVIAADGLAAVLFNVLGL